MSDIVFSLAWQSSSFKEVYIYIYRDLSLMVKYETFNLCYMGSNPIDLICFSINKRKF